MSNSDYEQIFIAEPHFNKAFAKMTTKRLEGSLKAQKFFNVYMVISILVVGGFFGWMVWYAVAEDELNSLIETLMIYGFVFLVVLLLPLFMKARYKAVRVELEKRREYVATEVKLLEELRDQMSPAEWANYKLQMENQRLLQEINKKNTKTTSTSSWSFETEV